MTQEELMELLAEKEHEGWSRWMRYLINRCSRRSGDSLIVPMARVERWQKQIDTPYAELSPREKQSDRDEVAHILPILDAYVASRINNETPKESDG